uniref:Uncharacterized protein n=1 Tax=Plectus sambesii TaxID=2011161 RepID=A0A914VYS5_9BILA
MSTYSSILATVIALTVLLSGVQSVRQCSCKEQENCIKDVEALGQGCVDQCWSITEELTKKSKQLRKCFQGKEGEIEESVQCFQKEMKGCAPNAKGPTIPAQSMDGIMAAAENQIRATIKRTLDSGIAGDMKKVIAVTEKFSTCAKKCLIAKTADGVCMKKYSCQPLLPNEASAKQIFKKCSHFDFKKQAGPLCQCALNAGVKDLSTYCSVLMLMAPQK